MERLSEERFAEIIKDKETCEFCEDCGNDEECLNCEKVKPATVDELRWFWMELSALVKAQDEGRVVELPFVAMVEQSLQDGEMKPQRDQRFNGRYAVVYSGKGKWGCPLIDICGTAYNSDQAEERKNELTCAEAEAALSCQSCRESGTEKVCEDKRTGYVCPNKAAIGGGGDG